MKKLVFVLCCVFLFSVPALAVSVEDFTYQNDDGSTYTDWDNYYYAIACESLFGAGVTLDVDSYWTTDLLGVTTFDMAAFESDLRAAIAEREAAAQAATEPAEPEQAQLEPTEPEQMEPEQAEPEPTELEQMEPEQAEPEQTDSELDAGNEVTGDEESLDDPYTGYPVGTYFDEAGNAFSPDGELLSPGTTPAAPAGTYDAPEDLLLAGESEAELDVHASGPTVYNVSDMRSVDDGSVSLVSGLKALIVSIFGEYEPILTTAAVTETVDNVTTTTLIDVVASGAAGVDFEWLSGVLLFGILLFCLLKLLGGILK